VDSSQSTPADTKTLSVRSDVLAKAPAAKSPVVDSKAVETPCPKCGTKLVNPQGLGWCPKCGYCRSLSEVDLTAMAPETAPVRKPSPLGVVEFYDVLCRMPPWLRTLLGGMSAVAALSVGARFVLPPDSLVRALWSTLELLLGIIGLVFAQAWALVRIAPEEEGLGSKDILFATRLWNLTFKRLPDTRRQVWVGSWSVTAGVCAVFLVGGFSYWAQFYQPKKLAAQELLAAAKELAEGKEKSLTESIEDFADKQDLTKKKDDKDTPKPDTRPMVQCVVIGYMVEGKQLAGLVLATLEQDRLTYVGTVRKGFTEQQSQEILQQLATAVRPEPLIKGLTLSAIWVKPEVFCEVHHSGADKDGMLVNMNFGGLLKKD